jgi:hypothetical protein
MIKIYVYIEFGLIQQKNQKYQAFHFQFELLYDSGVIYVNVFAASS